MEVYPIRAMTCEESMAKKKGEEVLETQMGPYRKYIFPYPNSPNDLAIAAKDMNKLYR